jgi:hypothetical protein
MTGRRRRPTHPLQTTGTELEGVGDSSGGASGLLTRGGPSLDVHSSGVGGPRQSDDQLALGA